MSTEQRDTHFRGFANLLFDDVEGMFMDLACAKFVVGYEAEQAQIVNDIQLFLARRAYDLVLHTLLHVEHINLDQLGYEEHVTRIPDMTELPKEQQ